MGDPAGPQPVGGPGLTVRAVSPTGLVADILPMPWTHEVALTAFYGSPLTYLGYMPLELTQENSWVRETQIIDVGDFPDTPAITPDGAKVFVPNSNGTLSVIDVASDTVRATTPVGNSPKTPAITPDGGKVFVPNSYGNTVSVIDVASDAVISTIPVGDYPQTPAITPDNAQVYVPNREDDTVSVLRNDGRREFIGPKRQDQGFDPPLGLPGNHRAGAIVSRQTHQVMSCLIIDAVPPESLAVEWTSGGIAIASVTADKITKIWEAQGPGEPPKKLVGPGGGFPGASYTQVLISFESDTGKLLEVMPTKGRSIREAGPGYIVSPN